jgi:hypothetical protein
MRSTTVFIFIIFLLSNILVGCIKSKKESGLFMYIEVEQMDPELEKCFKEKLYNQWASLEELKPHKNSEKYTGNNPLNKYNFKDYSEFDASKDTAGTRKMMVRVYGDGDTATTFFQLQRFEWEKEGIWSRNMNLGNFRVQDRPNDNINPGKVDEEEICEMMVRLVILASFK